ncbi:hypothetical protein LR48_Vigan511s004500 [Vigna angularis]|uniref:Uncharacterized protein n=1 Tax=Phaseolus angularis TaxID=3914 RepID=A0A0L9TCH4_PHAAN|nr:hypothetical protein LR48_Vigan511s004500 [Vigna angularis]
MNWRRTPSPPQCWPMQDMRRAYLMPPTNLFRKFSLEDAADDLEIGKKIFNKQKQVYSEPEIPITLPDLPIHLNALLAIEPIGINVVLNVHDCRDEILNDNSLELTFDSADDAYVNIDFEVETVQSDNFIEFGLNFYLTQFSENFECDCESGSCSICTKINFVMQPDSKVQTDATNCELDLCAELKKARNAENIKATLWEERSAEKLGEVSIPVSHTQQLPVEGELLMQQFAWRRKKKHLALDDKFDFIFCC